MFGLKNNGYDIPCVKIMLLGDAKSGKTTLLKKKYAAYRNQKYVFNEANYVATIGVDFISFHNKEKNNQIKFQVWDTAGKENFRAITASYYRDARHCIICVDFSKDDTWDNVKLWLAEIQKYGPPDVPVTLVATKSDLLKENIKDKIALFQEKFCHPPCQFDAVYITSAKKDGLEFNFKLGEKQGPDRPSNQPEVCDEIFKATGQYLKKEQTKHVNKTTLDFRNIKVTPSQYLWKQTKHTMSPFKPDQNVITVGALRRLCKEYLEGSEGYANPGAPIRNNGIWKKWWGCDYGSKSMRKLATLCKDKKNDASLTGQEINDCLSKHRIVALNTWIEESAISTSKPSSGTEYVIREIYNQSIKDDQEFIQELSVEL